MISVGALAIIIPAMFWFFNKVEEKADKVDVKEVDAKIEKNTDRDIEQIKLLGEISGQFKAQQTINASQQAINEQFLEKMK